MQHFVGLGFHIKVFMIRATMNRIGLKDLVAENKLLIRAVRPYIQQSDLLRVLKCKHIEEPGTTGERYHCRSPLCVLCHRYKAFRCRELLIDQLRKLVQDYGAVHILGFTLPALDCATDDLRDTAAFLCASWNRLVRSIGGPEKHRHVMASFRAVELALDGSDIEPTEENLHLHCIVCMPPSYRGRYRLNREQWQELWQNASRGRARRAHVIGINATKADAWARYCTKADYQTALSQIRWAAKNPGRYAARVRQMSGIHLYRLTRDLQVKLEDALPVLGTDPQAFYGSQRRYRRSREQLAIRMNRTCGQIPIEGADHNGQH